MTTRLSLPECRRIALQALDLTIREWDEMADEHQVDPLSVELCVERISALLLIRLVALGMISTPTTTMSSSKVLVTVNISTSGICRKTLIDDEPWWTDQITQPVVQQTKKFVQFILLRYSDLPFHNVRHAHHVVLSANKLLDFLLAVEANDFLDGRPPPAFGLRGNPLAFMALLFAALVHDVEHLGVSNRQLANEEHPLALVYNDGSINEQNSLHISFDEFLKDDYAQLRAAMFATPDSYRYFRSTVVSMVLSTDISSPERAQISKSKWKEGFSEAVDPQAALANSPRRSSMVSDISMPRARGNQGRRGSLASTGSAVSDVTMDSHAIWMRTRQNGRQQRKLSVDSTNDSIALMYQRRQGPSSGHLKTSPNRCNGELDDSFTSGADPCLGTNLVIEVQESEFPKELVASLTEKHPVNKIRRRNSTQNGRQQRRLSVDSTKDSIALMYQRRQGPSSGHLQTSPIGCNGEFEDSFTSLAVDSVKYASADPCLGTNLTIEVQESEFPKEQVASLSEKPPGNKIRRRNSTQSYCTLASGSYQSYAAESIGLAQRRLEGIAPTRRRVEQLERENASPARFDDDDSSLSLTPPSSDDDEDERAPISRMSVPKPNDMVGPLRQARMTSRRASTGNVPMQFRSLVASQSIDEDKVANVSLRRLRSSKSNEEGGRRSSVVSGKYRKRLGIRRSIDFSGESINIYSRASGSFSALTTDVDAVEPFCDEPDELKASVVLELMLRAADVAHLMQNWSSMSKGTSMLFHELAVAYKAGRGPNPANMWFDNQIKAVENYVLPLALQLDETGVFGEFTGAVFTASVEKNRDNWLTKGFDLTASNCESAGL